MTTEFKVYCDLCAGKSIKSEMVLRIIEKNISTAHITNEITGIVTPITGQKVPTFDVELDTTETEFQAEFFCMKCNTTCFYINKDIEYDDAEEQIMIPEYNPCKQLGYSVLYRSEYAKSIFEEEKLPTIKRPGREPLIPVNIYNH